MCILWFIWIYYLLSFFAQFDFILYFNFAQYYLNCLVILKLDEFSFSLSADFQFSIMQYCIAMNSNQASRAIFASPLNYSNQIYFKLSHVIDFNVHSMEWQLMLITLFTMSSQINLPLLCIKASSATNVFFATREPWTFTVSANINPLLHFSWILWFFLRKSVCFTSSCTFSQGLLIGLSSALSLDCFYAIWCK